MHPCPTPLLTPTSFPSLSSSFFGERPTRLLWTAQEHLRLKCFDCNEVQDHTCMGGVVTGRHNYQCPCGAVGVVCYSCQEATARSGLVTGGDHCRDCTGTIPLPTHRFGSCPFVVVVGDQKLPRETLRGERRVCAVTLCRVLSKPPPLSVLDSTPACAGCSMQSL